MEEDHAVLLLDDGELEPVAELLDRSGLVYRRLRGADISEDLSPPQNLLISTPRHAAKVRRGSPPGAPPGRPVRIIAVDEDSPSLRRMMRNMGFSLLVRQPAHTEVWRLLIQRALFQGDERRRESRLPVGAQISVEETSTSPPTLQASRPSLLVDISNRGCHFISDEPFPLGAKVEFRLSPATAGGEALTLSGEIIRTGPWPQGDASQHSCAMVFGDDLDDASRTGLARMINARISGPLSLAAPAPEGLALPCCDSQVLPGLQLDDETDPPIATDLRVDLELSGGSFDDDDRRKDRRADYQQRIEVEQTGETSVLIGRDLSSGGMRVEHFADAKVGARVALALYGPSESEPLQIDAEILRDDGDRGVALRFCNLPREVAQRLERFVACLPAVESLEDGEAEGLGSILTEVRAFDSERR